ncbi:DUF742 domain-containing protein [Actinocorallia longicatena]|uniref:DUF742 domain-containing protein n=1 Tax=Actinocorallia longicatena TaxID=111803 RepID=A0ABP6QHL9_9ACTN
MTWRDDGLGPRLPDPRMIEVREEARWVVPPSAPTVPVPADDEEDHGAVVRPFVLTGGRTRPVDERLRVETLVSAAPAALSAPLTFERRQIVHLCQRPVSVAEIAGALGAPVGVARVLIADLVSERLVTVHDHLGLADARSRPILERIREGVRAL